MRCIGTPSFGAPTLLQRRDPNATVELGGQTAVTVTDFDTRYGSSASGPPSEP